MNIRNIWSRVEGRWQQEPVEPPEWSRTAALRSVLFMGGGDDHWPRSWFLLWLQQGARVPDLAQTAGLSQGLKLLPATRNGEALTVSSGISAGKHCFREDCCISGVIRIVTP